MYHTNRGYAPEVDEQDCPDRKTASQHADKLAVFGIEYALEMLDKGNSPEDKETAVDLISAEDLK